MKMMMSKYDLHDMQKISKKHSHDDLFICALGFENRSLGSLQIINDYYKCNESIMLKYDINKEENEINYYDLKQLLDIITNDNVYECEFNTGSGSRFGCDDVIKIVEKLCNKKQNISVTVDISSFSTSLIIQILNILFDACVSTVRILYTEAELYYPLKEPEYTDEEYLSSGVKEIFSLPNFYGIHSAGYSPLLIIFLGFEPIRARGVMNLYQPAKKIGILGVPSKPELNWRLTVTSEMYKHVFNSKDELLRLPEFNYKEVLFELEKLYERYCDLNNITITPLGSKMQTIAVLIFLKNHPDVQLLLSTPIKYDPLRYSEGISETYEILIERKVFKPKKLDELN